MLAIWKREFKSYLHTVIGWLFMAAILFFCRTVFYRNKSVIWQCVLFKCDQCMRFYPASGGSDPDDAVPCGRTEK